MFILQTPSTMVLKCPFLITCMEMPDFGDVDNPAIQRRLQIFNAKPLSKPTSRANQWLRQNCMEVFHYISLRLKDQPLFSDDDDDDDDVDGDDEVASRATNDSQGAVYNDFSGAAQQLLSRDEIVNLDLIDESSSSECDEPQRYTPFENFTTDAKDKALQMTSEIDPSRLAGDDPKHQWLEGVPINSTIYHRAVMLLVCSHLRTAKWDRYKIVTIKARTNLSFSCHITYDVILSPRYTEDNYHRLYREGYPGTNSVYDAWLLLNKTSRKEFDLKTFFRRYPGMKSQLPSLVVDDDEDGDEDGNAKQVLYETRI